MAEYGTYITQSTISGNVKVSGAVSAAEPVITYTYTFSLGQGTPASGGSIAPQTTISYNYNNNELTSYDYVKNALTTYDYVKTPITSYDYVKTSIVAYSYSGRKFAEYTAYASHEYNEVTVYAQHEDVSVTTYDYVKTALTSYEYVKTALTSYEYVKTALTTYDYIKTPVVAYTFDTPRNVEAGFKRDVLKSLYANSAFMTRFAYEISPETVAREAIHRADVLWRMMPSGWKVQ